MQGAFLTIEGTDGAGKTTHLELMANWFDAKGYEVTVTREPGGTGIGERIRDIVLNGNQQRIDDDTELLLIFAARMQHLKEVIIPSVESGHIVLCDRFTDATYAYQGGGRGIDQRRIEQLENWVQKGRQPDLTLVLDVPLETALLRTRYRGAAPDRFERQPRSFKQAVRQIYLDRAARFPDRIKVVDASAELAAVQEAIIAQIEHFFYRRTSRCGGEK